MTTHRIEFKKMGIPAIDEQHGRLVSLLESLLSWSDKGYGLAATFDAFAALFDYTQTHFQFEEQLMREHGYPQLAEHIEQHEAIIQGLTKLMSDLEAGSDVEERLASSLRRWIVLHIDVEDLAYAEFMGTTNRQ